MICYFFVVNQIISHRLQRISQRFHLNFKSVKIREIRERKKLCAIQIIDERKLAQIHRFSQRLHLNFKSVRIREICAIK